MSNQVDGHNDNIHINIPANSTSQNLPLWLVSTHMDIGVNMGKVILKPDLHSMEEEADWEHYL